MKEKNIEKGLNYKEQITKLSKAIKNEYYYEALIIDYAIIEDRIDAILYYLGLLNEKRNYFNNNFSLIKQKLENDTKTNRLSLKKISNKIIIIKYILKNYDSNILYNLNPNYVNILRKKLKKINIDEFLNVLNRIEIWKDDRNSIVHCLMKNKLNIDISELAEDGFVLAREIDRYCGFIKRKDINRK